jgi:hypothetical protein
MFALKKLNGEVVGNHATLLRALDAALRMFAQGEPRVAVIDPLTREVICVWVPSASWGARL